ncbi:MAG: S1 RNA-binding domain-containing protein [Caldilineaceae bacterium]|nr:S1 RNA-binding domain-containing protein [Caldilineaceae bacterium]HRJ40276.1 S1 RNA-binding domain-containing protein [Caldilineaceae bacterium]
MNDVNFQIAHSLAERLVRANTDHNELAKASAYLNQTHDAAAFFTWLDWMATPRVSEKLARSRQTPEYYRQIRDACQGLHQISDVEDLAQTLGWAVRLMRYIPHAQPVSPQELDALLTGRSATRPAPRRAEIVPTPPHRRNISDLQTGMQLSGTVKRTAPFGAFVDIGVGRDGLVHISKLKDGYVVSTEDVATVGQQVTVWVESVDLGQRKISLTMIPPKGGVEAVALPLPTPPAAQSLPVSQPVPPKQEARPTLGPRPQAVRLSPGDKPETGQQVMGKITAIESSRLVVDIGLAEAVSLTFDRLPGKPSRDDVEEQYEVGQGIEAWVHGVNRQGRVQLTFQKG